LLRHSPQRGFSMIEILVTLVVVAFGLLGLASFTTRATALGVEASQRARAATLLADMGNRIAANRPGAANYVGAAALGATVNDATYCASSVTTTLAARDLCEWNNLLAGSADAKSNGDVDALTFRGCITQPAASDPVFIVTIAWAANVPGVPPADACAAGIFGDDSFRRILRTQVRVPALTA
jgi:type IV pilus assembly protein PilV